MRKLTGRLQRSGGPAPSSCQGRVNDVPVREHQQEILQVLGGAPQPVLPSRYLEKAINHKKMFRWRKVQPAPQTDLDG